MGEVEFYVTDGTYIKFVRKFPFPPEKDDFLLFDGKKLKVICRIFDLDNEAALPTLLIEQK